MGDGARQVYQDLEFLSEESKHFSVSLMYWERDSVERYWAIYEESGIKISPTLYLASGEKKKGLYVKLTPRGLQTCFCKNSNSSRILQNIFI